MHAAHQIIELFIDKNRKDTRIHRIIVLAKENNIKIIYKNKQDLNNINIKNQGIVAFLKMATPKTEKELLDLSFSNNDILLVLDNIQDPHNLGAIMRTSLAAGVKAIITPKDNSAPITDVVYRSAAGAASLIPLYHVTNISRTLTALKEKNFWVIGAAGESKQTVYVTDLTGPLVWVMGAEGKGIRQQVKKHCDILVTIPLAPLMESLNVSVATAICLFETNRQRKKTG